MKKRNLSFDSAYEMLDDLLEDCVEAAKLLAEAVSKGTVTLDDPDIDKVEYVPVNGVMLFHITIAS